MGAGVIISSMAVTISVPSGEIVRKEGGLDVRIESRLMCVCVCVDQVHWMGGFLRLRISKS